MNSECGGDTICGCPVRGGQRQRCIKSTAALSRDSLKQEYFNQKSYLECLEQNGCESIDPRMGSCGYKNCRGNLGSVTLVPISASQYRSNSDIYTITLDAYLGLSPPRQCGDYHEDGIVRYKGFKGIEDAASSTQASVGIIAMTFAALWLLF